MQPQNDEWGEACEVKCTYACAGFGGCKSFFTHKFHARVPKHPVGYRRLAHEIVRVKIVVVVFLTLRRRSVL